MKRRLKAIRILVNRIRSNSKNKTERRIRLRMLMENCREDLYGFVYNFEDAEIRIIDFLKIFYIVFMIARFMFASYNTNEALIFLVAFLAVSYRKHDIFRHREVRIMRERLKTKKVLGLVSKKELRKLDINLQEWYMLRNDIIGPS